MQLVLNLNPVESTESSTPLCGVQLASLSTGFEFGGRVLSHPKNSFQYRMGRKVQPKDEWFDRMYKTGAYD